MLPFLTTNDIITAKRNIALFCINCDINCQVDSVNNEDHKKDHPMCGESVIVTLPR